MEQSDRYVLVIPVTTQAFHGLPSPIRTAWHEAEALRLALLEAGGSSLELAAQYQSKALWLKGKLQQHFEGTEQKSVPDIFLTGVDAPCRVALGGDLPVPEPDQVIGFLQGLGWRYMSRSWGTVAWYGSKKFPWASGASAEEYMRTLQPMVAEVARQEAVPEATVWHCMAVWRGEAVEAKPMATLSDATGQEQLYEMAMVVFDLMCVINGQPVGTMIHPFHKFKKDVRESFEYKKAEVVLTVMLPKLCDSQQGPSTLPPKERKQWYDSELKRLKKEAKERRKRKS